MAAKSLVLRKQMTTDPQNLFNPQQSPLTPGRVITKVKRYVSPTGQVVELGWLTTTLRDQQGIWHTEETVEVDPPLADGTTPSDCSSIRECSRCRSLITRSCCCKSCRLIFCEPCTVEIETEGQKARVCLECAESIRHPFWRLAKKFIWG